MTEVEQRRRDLLEHDRPLYRYIAAREVAKALDSLGDRLSGYSHEAANMVWGEAAARETEADALAEGAAP